jgi:hypothetical protein
VLAEAGDCHLLIIQGVSEKHHTILGACLVQTADEICYPLGASFVSRGEFRIGRKRGRREA